MRSAVGLSQSTQHNERFRTFMENNHAAEYERQQVTDSLLYSSKVGHWEKMVKRNLHPWTCVNFYYRLKAYIVLTFYAEKNQSFQHKSSKPQLIRTKFGYLPVIYLLGHSKGVAVTTLQTTRPWRSRSECLLHAGVLPLRGQVKERQRSGYFGRDWPILNKMGAGTSPAEPEFLCVVGLIQTTFR